MASVIVLFIFLISSLNDLKRGGWLATQSTPPLDPPLKYTIKQVWFVVNEFCSNNVFLRTFKRYHSILSTASSCIPQQCQIRLEYSIAKIYRVSLVKRCHFILLMTPVKTHTMTRYTIMYVENCGHIVD